MEIVQDLSTESFLQVLRRFVTHHEWPSMFISDNGKSFVGTEKELKKLFVEGKKENKRLRRASQGSMEIRHSP